MVDETEDQIDVEESQADYNAQRIAEQRGEATPTPKGEEDDDEEVAPVDDKPAEPKPWQKKNTPPESIPYGRFAEVNSERRVLAQRAAELEARLAEYESAKKQAEAVTDPTELDLSAYVTATGEPDVDRYLKDLTKATKEQAIREARDMFRAEEAERTAQAQRQRTIESYTQRITEHAKIDPEISAKEEYVVAVLQQNQQYVHPSVIESIAEDENGPAIIAALAEDEDLLRSLMQGPARAMKTIAKLSAMAEINGKPKQSAPVIPPKPAFTPAPKPSVRIPATVDNARGGRKAPEDMNPKEYAAYRAKGGSAW